MSASSRTDATPGLSLWIDLAAPSGDAVRDAFAALPRRGGLRIGCAWDRRHDLLATLAGCGAFALRAGPSPDFDTVTITALKGKAGACYETGRSATYLGAAAAVMDDDRHLVAGTLRVCEKTGGLYQLEPYAGLLRVTGADPDLLRRLDTDPVSFDCNTFEADAERIAASLISMDAAPDDTVGVYYPGPFSLLVLRDGSIVRRARPVRIAARLVPGLRERDGLLLLPSSRATEAVPAANYRDGYASAGAGCLLEELSVIAAAGAPPAEVAVPEPAWDALRAAPPALRDRIRRLIAGREPYFILTGSDPREAGGCCPSTDVGSANRLVESGLLASHRTPAAADACTTTVYALAGEIDGAGASPTFRIRDDLRTRAAAELTRAKGAGTARTALRGAILALIAVSLAIAARRSVQAARPLAETVQATLTRVLSAPDDRDRIYLCFFQGRERCAPCETMERLGRETVTAAASMPENGPSVEFRKIDTADPANRSLRRNMVGGMSTLGLVRCRNGGPADIRMLTDEAWALRSEPAAFTAMLHRAISAIRNEGRR